MVNDVREQSTRNLEDTRLLHININRSAKWLARGTDDEEALHASNGLSGNKNQKPNRKADEEEGLVRRAENKGRREQTSRRRRKPERQENQQGPTP
ncbi:hypothetical protein CCMSSC00406_0006383 [Pleurotus cornucopiae]|uniref:Uncharacterized protein n=1 Tax=Pleurotus cornucopiae TaxID=5321 RepID=A0ACB7IS23_PLECO|nr:hypothetical protein CCMSSC00406_0006383 [Pleurotus cornucopiae]